MKKITFLLFFLLLPFKSFATNDPVGELFKQLLGQGMVGHDCSQHGKVNSYDSSKYIQSSLNKIILRDNPERNLRSAIALISADFCAEGAKNILSKEREFTYKEHKKAAKVLKNGVDDFIEFRYGNGRSPIDFIETYRAFKDLETKIGWKSLLNYFANVRDMR